METNNNKNSEFEVQEISSSSAADLIGAGNVMMQTKAQYTTAVQVMKPRNIEKIIAAVEKEAELAGEDFYYSYPQGGKYIEGTGIQGALILARNWGNCAVNSRPVETKDSIIVFGDFIDFETGFNLTRAFIGKRKVLRNKSGKEIYDRDRNDEIVFQIMNSKAIRNVILNAVPNYVSEAGLKRAKEGMRKQLEDYIKRHGIDKARTKIIERAAKLNISSELIEKNFGKSNIWDADKLMRINGVLKGIEEGYQTVKDAFPSEMETDEKQDEKTQLNKPEDEKAVIKEPEVESAEKESVESESKKEGEDKSERKKPAENKSDKRHFSERSLNFKEEEELTPDMPLYWVKECEKTKTLNEYNKFLKEHKRDIESFSPADYESIIKSFEKHETKLKK